MLERFQREAEGERSLLRSVVVLAFAIAITASVPLAADAAGTPQRILSIGGATTEIVYALGAERRLVGVDSTSTYPPPAKALPNVGYMRQLSAEGVLAMRPDLILMEEGAGPPPVVSIIDAAGVPVVHVPAGHDAPAIGAKIRTVADAIGKPQEGRALAAKTKTALAELAKQLATVKARKRVLFILSMTGGSPVAAGAGTGGDAIIRLAGGINVFAGVEGYKTVSAEAAAALAPDVILMMANAGPAPDDDAVLQAPAIAATPAGRNKALIRMDGLYLLGFGPRTADAARALAHRLYPQLDLAARTAGHER